MSCFSVHLLRLFRISAFSRIKMFIKRFKRSSPWVQSNDLGGTTRPIWTYKYDNDDNTTTTTLIKKCCRPRRRCCVVVVLELKKPTKKLNVPYLSLRLDVMKARGKTDAGGLDITSDATDFTAQLCQVAFRRRLGVAELTSKSNDGSPRSQQSRVVARVIVVERLEDTHEVSFLQSYNLLVANFLWAKVCPTSTKSTMDPEGARLLTYSAVCIR